MEIKLTPEQELEYIENKLFNDGLQRIQNSHSIKEAKINTMQMLRDDLYLLQQEIEEIMENEKDNSE